MKLFILNNKTDHISNIKSILNVLMNIQIDINNGIGFSCEIRISVCSSVSGLLQMDFAYWTTSELKKICHDSG